MKQSILTKLAFLTTVIFLSSCSNFSRPKASAYIPQTAAIEGDHAALWKGNTEMVWTKLQHVSSSNLNRLLSSTTDAEQAAWLKLALIGKKDSLNTPTLVNELRNWRVQNPAHPANRLIPADHVLDKLQTAAMPRKIAILLPQAGPYGSSGQTVREGFLNAYYSNMAEAGKQEIKFYDTQQGVNIDALYQQAMQEGADIIIGPLLKENVSKLSKIRSFKAPIIALNYTDVNWGSLPPNFYEYGLLPEDEALQIADRAYQAGRTKAIIIAPRNAWGKRLAFALNERFRTLGGSVQDSWYYTAQSDFREEIAKLMQVDASTDKEYILDDNKPTQYVPEQRHDFDVIFLLSSPKQAHVIVPLLKYHHANHIPIYATSSIYSAQTNPINDVDLDGVTVCDIPWRLRMTPERSANALQPNRLYAVGQDAYLLSQHLPRVVLLPNFPMYASTGALTLSPTHQIHRRLPCKTIRNGQL